MQRKDVMNVFSQDISEKMRFSRSSYDYQCIFFNDHFHCGVWRMTKKDTGRICGYEVVKGIRRIQPDGSIIYRYPGDEQFGRSGFYGYDLNRLLRHLDEWMEI